MCRCFEVQSLNCICAISRVDALGQSAIKMKIQIIKNVLFLKALLFQSDKVHSYENNCVLTMFSALSQDDLFCCILLVLHNENALWICL